MADKCHRQSINLYFNKPYSYFRGTEMNTQQNITWLFIAGALILTGCDNPKAKEMSTQFTRIDSLTEVYLDLQDSLHTAWNLMINDDNQKIKTMHSLLHELEISAQLDPEKSKAFAQRIDQLKRIRYTPKSMSNSDLVAEYDFASNSLVNELITLSEGHSAYSYNTTMQKLVVQIRESEESVENYRSAYDAVVMAYNRFISENREHMREIDHANKAEKKPLFQMASE
ncbi:MAG: hypothetical protein KF845_13160 [Cyclobacteriaceae bacterium]|nr:hypothetical protein [Cyclobacteriaceae bacterium]